MATGGIRMLKFSVQQSIAEIKTSYSGHWIVKYSFPMQVTASHRGYSELPLEDTTAEGPLKTRGRREMEEEGLFERGQLRAYFFQGALFTAAE